MAIASFVLAAMVACCVAAPVTNERPLLHRQSSQGLTARVGLKDSNYFLLRLQARDDDHIICLICRICRSEINTHGCKHHLPVRAAHSPNAGV